MLRFRYCYFFVSSCSRQFLKKRTTSAQTLHVRTKAGWMQWRAYVRTYARMDKITKSHRTRSQTFYYVRCVVVGASLLLAFFVYYCSSTATKIPHTSPKSSSYLKNVRAVKNKRTEGVRQLLIALQKQYVGGQDRPRHRKKKYQLRDAKVSNRRAGHHAMTQKRPTKRYISCIYVEEKKTQNVKKYPTIAMKNSR